MHDIGRAFDKPQLDSVFVVASLWDFSRRSSPAAAGAHASGASRHLARNQAWRSPVDEREQAIDDVLEQPDVPLPLTRTKRWEIGRTNDFDAHSPHWHGNTVVINQMRTDVTSLAPMQMVTADMVPDDVGIWLFHCLISFHSAGGMVGRCAVIP